MRAGQGKGGWLLALLLTLAAPVAQAIDWERLVNPGPVIAGHADTEKDCKACHTPFSRDEQRGLCLDCHDKVSADIRDKRGFHGRTPAAATGQCRNCHTDHEGREADVIRLDPQTFNHGLADFALEGAHKGLACTSCHEPKSKHRDAKSTCIGCHAGKDAHRKSLGTECQDCHTATSWKEVRFDHGKATSNRYPLTGAHARVDCQLCHAGQRYKETPTTCVACHRIDDAHGGQRGNECQKCHNTVAWKKPIFDHLKETGFALSAGHAGLACQACHAGGDFRKARDRQCVDCHRADDAHQGRNGPKCQDCHATRAWSEAKFDHGRETRFPLRGAHAEIGCVACHKGDVHQEKLRTACESCHRDRDPHQGKLGTACGNCHGEKSWLADIRFDHDLTTFPLVGLHATASCEACHADRRFRGTPGACADCHREDDVHKSALGKNCAVCHTPNDWRIWAFDHNARTDFRLEGAHAGLQCAACHVRPMREGAKARSACGDCHAGDDVHNGQFGRDCARCHDSTSFTSRKRR